jgi:predicted RNA polymerase sigma factor
MDMDIPPVEAGAKAEAALIRDARRASFILIDLLTERYASSLFLARSSWIRNNLPQEARHWVPYASARSSHLEENRGRTSMHRLLSFGMRFPIRVEHKRGKICC